ncbi:MAG: hypothetical protein HN333_00070 [Rhodospirillaceae bacterium]|jgi:hypothetical protein|nr:hypothetical protein [Rhodospirillaceae bacterium]
MMADVTFDRLKPGGKIERLIDDLPSDVRDSFTAAQRDALSEAMSTHTWRRQKVDIRLSLPILSNRYFMTVVAGREQRPRMRRRAERVFHPLGTIGNTLFIGAITTVILSVVMIVTLVYSSILVP